MRACTWRPARLGSDLGRVDCQEAVTAGKVKYIGLSECGAEDIRKAHAIHPITLLEQEWSLWSRDIEVCKSGEASPCSCAHNVVFAD